MMIDSGSDWNLLSVLDWERLMADKRDGRANLYGEVTKPLERARAYGASETLEALASFHAWIEVPGADKPESFAKIYVVKNGDKSILGRATATQMRMLKVGVEVSSIVERNEGKEKEFPSIPDFIFDFDVDEKVAPTVNAYVNIPEAYRERASERLRVMENQGIIEKVSKAPRWISGLSAVPKGKDDFRLVVNMMGPNKAIRRRFFKMPSLEQIKVKLQGAKFFTKLDLTSAFHHVRLGESSKDMTTFLGPSGMYRFCRLNFGVSSAPEGFQQKMEEIFQSIPNVVIYIDDILVYCNTLEGLKKTTAEVLELLKANNLTLNAAKCDWEKESIEFLGHELTAEGFNISKKKVEDVLRFRRPRDSSELKSFLGLASFLSAYIKDFSTISAPLWEVISSGQFAWKEEQDTAFKELRNAIAGCTVKQGFFSGTDATFLYTDASPVALGAVLVQQNPEGKYRTIAFASKLLSPTEKRYAQTQKEALGIVWGSEHFWFYLVGRRFTIRTDAEGIAFILKRDHTQTKRIMKRSDAWALRMESFDYTVEYVKGEQNIADPSSRLVEGSGVESFEDGPTPGEIMTFTMDPPADVEFAKGRVTLEEIKFHSGGDRILKEVMESLESGDWKRSLGKFKSVAHELRVVDGLVTRMGELVVPEILRPKVLATAHLGHPGMTAMKSLLRGKVWWPGMLTHVENWVRSCKACKLLSKRDPPMPMLRAELPEAVWESVAVDFNGPYAGFGGIYVLLIVDIYSRFLIARPVKSTDFVSSRTVLDDVFDTFGNVRVIRSDNGPPFNGDEYRSYAEKRGIKATFSTPLDAQQNGAVETYMRLVNKGMTIPSIEGGSWRESLANTIAAHNGAICSATGKAPDVLMFGRSLLRNIPNGFGRNETASDKEIRHLDWAQKMKHKEWADKKRDARFSKLQVGDKVYVSRPTKKKGQSNFDPRKFTIIAKKHGTLQLLSELGNVISRTVTFVKKVQERGAESQIEAEPSTMDQNADVPKKVDEPESSQEQQNVQAAPEQRQEVRRSERLRSMPTKLKSYVCPLEAVET